MLKKNEFSKCVNTISQLRLLEKFIRFSMQSVTGLSRDFRAAVRIIAITIFALSAGANAQESPCEGIQKTIQQKKLQLAEYAVTLEQFRNSGESDLISLLNFKISELKEQIRDQEKMSNCADKAFFPKFDTTSPVKSETDEYVTRSCGDLQNTIIQLIRKTNSLERRRSSTFSELSSTEKKDLYSGLRELAAVRGAIRARCGVRREIRSAGNAKKSGRTLAQ